MKQVKTLIQTDLKKN